METIQWIKNKLETVLITVNAWDTNKMRNLLFLFVSLIITSCGIDICDNDLLFEVSSPDKQYIASVFERNCGATTPYMRIVSSRLSNEEFNPNKHDNWVFNINGQSNIEVNWTSSRELHILFSGTGSQVSQKEKWRDVIIKYD